MDRELASAVLDRWDAGLPVAETALVKAASVLGIDPMSALVEARFYTYFDQYCLEKRAMTRVERAVFSAAAGLSSGVMEKTASRHGVTPDELIFESLRERNFVPDLQKIANLGAIMGGGQPGADPSGGAGGGAGGAGAQGGQGQADPSQQGAEAMMAPPQADAAVQQQPQARFKPSPTAPDQMMASPDGNMQGLIQETQGAYGDQAQDNGGMPPTGMPQPPPEPPSPEERVQQVGPNLDPATVQRYAEQLQRFEQGVGQSISDPKQMVKFVKELQKVDGKRIDQGIKAMGQQLEQEQAQELGVDGGMPTIDGSGGQQVMAPKGQSATPQGSSQQQAGQAQSTSPQQGDGQQGTVSSGATPPKQAPKPQQNQAAQAAVEKVANAARLIARAHATR